MGRQSVLEKAGIKYVVVPGHILSKNDDDRHYISASMLIRLYNVNPRECVIKHGDIRDIGKKFSGLIHLYPDYHGRYEIPKG